jgi:hypothetical protein
MCVNLCIDFDELCFVKKNNNRVKQIILKSVNVLRDKLKYE